MTPDQAREHASGYAAGREDASNARTVRPDGEPYTGFIEFAAAYADGWADYNSEDGRRGYMINAKDAYNAWQSSGGRTIYADDIRSAVVARSASGTPSPETVAAYLPRGYWVTGSTDDEVAISGIDDAGWTLDDYVIPRLASGMIHAREVK